MDVDCILGFGSDSGLFANEAYGGDYTMVRQRALRP